jgi:RNA polymerase sigma-70 factor (ECF subfamily)
MTRTGAALADEIGQASDLELIGLAREGSERAFEEIVRRYSPRVLQVARKFFRQPAEVEDAAQEAFLKAYTQLSSFEGRGSFEGWLTRITTNLCLNMLRSAKRRAESTVSDLTQDQSEWLEIRMADVSAARHRSTERGLVAADLAEKVMSDLSPDDRLVLMSLEGDDLSVKEVAEMTGWSESKVKTQAFRARRRMREAVEKLLELKRKIKA